jgi:hypothetical protein
MKLKLLLRGLFALVLAILIWIALAHLFGRKEFTGVLNAGRQ